jgi:mRNA-degrading endonuclease RelE of RelBE toxin-antitoxin system
MEDLDVKALRRELEGFLRLRVGDYRVVYHLEPGQVLRLDYADIRDEVYDAFRRLRNLQA